MIDKQGRKYKPEEGKKKTEKKSSYRRGRRHTNTYGSFF
jgi:hypothetical protein